ncbi:hypothetical protein BCR44DRAFT_1498843 [Catenaria anguillulae PL171]|uniref:C2 domain-containing protein n=1 Tax=Catenaria anguillulae PL171 TaxID=765915 RepID=A0A1Y2HP20_9FUNG|nr:hypothetical protein BCR44DRAFT_1498843 [Catenaria anguillulae PL171]
MDLLSDTDAFVKLSVDLPIAHAERLHQARADAKRAAERAGLTDDGALGAEVHFARTATVTDSRAPVWHEQFDFAIHSVGGPLLVYLEVADEDSVTSHDVIGRGQVDLRSLFAAMEGEAGPLNADTLPPPPSAAPGAAEAGLTGGIKAARSVWVPLVGEHGESVGEVLLLVYYEPKTRLDRAKARVSQKVNEVKEKLTATVVNWITDWTAGQVKASFK